MTHKEESLKEELKNLARKMKEIYGLAEQEILFILRKHTKQFKGLEKLILKDLRDGNINNQEYKKIVKNEVFKGKKWDIIRRDMAEVLYESNVEATDFVNERLDGIYIESYNSGTYEVENHYRRNIGIPLMTVAVLHERKKKKETVIPYRSVKKSKDISYNMKNTNRVIDRELLKNKRLDAITNNCCKRMANKNYQGTNRTLELLMSSTADLGDYEDMLDVAEMGINIENMWKATLDNKTRDMHQELDGQVRALGEEFEVGSYKILYPRDPTAPPEMICNCRCTLEKQYPDYENTNYFMRENIVRDGEKNVIPHMTYREWEAWESEMYG